MPLPPPRRESFHFSPTAANLLDYSSLVALANDFPPGTLTFTQNEKAVLKESYTASSTSSYSHSGSNARSVHQAQRSTLPDDVGSRRASAATNSQAQGRKVSSLKLTPVTFADPPAHRNSPRRDPRPESQNTGPQRGAQPSVRSGPEDLKRPERRPSNSPAELESPDRAPTRTPCPAAARVEVTQAPPAVPPRPPPAALLVHN